MEENFNNLYIVLVEPRNPGNIGSAVRAMKNMGISRLRLVNPVKYRNHDEQKKMGYRSQEIVEASQEFNSLEDALADISLVFLTTTRKGKWKRDFLSPEKASQIIKSRIKKEKIAVVFGREDFGVTIDESQLANFYIKIPSAVSYPSLNLSQAVMVVVYEIYKSTLCLSAADSFPKTAQRKEFDRLIENMWYLMKTLELKEEMGGLYYRSLKRALNRTRWTKADIAVFDRTCKQVRWYISERKNLSDKEKK
jgi:TrmH family RNA methyltransferase